MLECSNGFRFQEIMKDITQVAILPNPQPRIQPEVWFRHSKSTPLSLSRFLSRFLSLSLSLSLSLFLSHPRGPVCDRDGVLQTDGVYPQKALCGGIPCSFLEPFARSWSHFVGIYRQNLTRSLEN